MNNSAIDTNELGKTHFCTDFSMYKDGIFFEIAHTHYTSGTDAYRIRVFHSGHEDCNISFSELIEAIKGIETNKTLKGALAQATNQLLDLQDELAKEKDLHTR